MFKELCNQFSLIMGISLILTNSCLAQFRPDRPTFFQDGQRFMEQEIRKLEAQQNNNNSPNNIEHPSQLLTINDGKLNWQKYLFQDAGFSVWMPSGISSEETVKIHNPIIGEIEFEVFATHPQSLRFISAYSLVDNLAKIGNEEQIFTAIKNGIIQRNNFNLVTDQTIPVSGYYKHYLVMEDSANQETIYFNIYVINNKVYVLAVGAKSTDHEEDINSFFDSFRLLSAN